MLRNYKGNRQSFIANQTCFSC